MEDVEISCEEDEAVHCLGDQRNTLSAAIAMDSRDQDDLGGHMGQIAQDSKDLENQGVS